MLRFQMNQVSPLCQTVQKSEAEEQDEAGELRDPQKKILVNDAALVSDLQQQPSTSADETVQIVRKKKREAEEQDEVGELEKCLKKRIRTNDKKIVQKQEAAKQDGAGELRKPQKKRLVKNALVSRPTAADIALSLLRLIVRKKKREVQDDAHEVEKCLKKRIRTNDRRILQKREAEVQDEAGELRKPLKKHLVKNAALISDLQQQPSTSADGTIPKRKIEAAQETELQNPTPHLEERYVVNAAVIPECRPQPASFATAEPGTSSVSESMTDPPVTNHGLSIPEYQNIYHSVVDPLLVTCTGEPCCYSLALGRLIKQHLWYKLRCPSVIEVEQVQESEQVYYTEKFSTPPLENFTPQIDLDVSEEFTVKQLPKKENTMLLTCPLDLADLPC